VADRTSPPARVEQSPKPSENGFAEPATPQVAHFAEASRPEANMQAAEEKPVVAPVVAALATASKQVEPSAPTLPSLVTADDKPALESNAAAEPFQQDGHAINIKGRGEGVTIEIGKGNWEVLVAALEQRLERSGNFFRGASVALDIGDRLLQEGQLRMVCDTLIAHGMKPGIVRTSSDRTFQTALTLSLASTLENKEGAPVESGQGAVSNVEAVQHFVYRGALRSGQVLKRRAHILIVGDVNPGAEVVASGDILVWGRLRGSAHAGADGDVRCVVAAFDIDPVQLRIADAIAVGNAGQNESGYRWPWRHEVDKRPEIARLINGQIIVEPWDEAKVAGSPILKRRR
jgi:septum site-determining protein MinC